MGNECCQQQKLNAFQFDVSSRLRQEDFLPVQFPKDDRYIQERIKQFPQLNIGKVLKHLNMDKYYWGAWEEGSAKGKGFLYRPNIFFYHGDFNMKPNNYGQIQLLQSGLKYKGDIKDGRAEGNGTLSHQNGLYFYDGTWRNSQPVTGSLTIRQISNQSNKTVVTFHEFPVGLTKISYPDGRQYHGIINHKTLAPQGRGKVTYKDGSVYEGQWLEGQFHGEGVFNWHDGSSYEGSYQIGKKHGYGKYIYPSRNIYQGEWIEGHQHGMGTLFNQSGDAIRKGVFKKGKFLTSAEI